MIANIVPAKTKYYLHDDKGRATFPDLPITDAVYLGAELGVKAVVPATYSQCCDLHFDSEV